MFPVPHSNAIYRRRHSQDGNWQCGCMLPSTWGREESLSTEKVLTAPLANLVGQVASLPCVQRWLPQQGIAGV